MPVLRPLSDNIVVRRDPPKGLSDVVYAAASEKMTTGLVLAVGLGNPQDDGTFEAPVVKPKDKISFMYYKDRPVFGKMQGGDVIIIKEGDIIGILD